MLSFSVEITRSAQDYLAGLLAKQEGDVNVRMFVLRPGTPEAETCLSYCRAGEQQEDDQILELDAFKVFFEQRSAPYLDGARVDYAADQMGGQLSIRAPNSRVPQVSADSPLEDRVNYILWNDINPGLAAHGGQVSLVEMAPAQAEKSAEGAAAGKKAGEEKGKQESDQIAVLKFGGGCQGCSMLDLTLREGVEKTLLEKLPELAGVRDITDHSDTSNAYYKDD
ncbi:MAG: NifU family protein [Cellvibrionales bacterium]|nr:NifU family protein [Cellvibrionales bacterium]